MIRLIWGCSVIKHMAMLLNRLSDCSCFSGNPKTNQHNMSAMAIESSHPDEKSTHAWKRVSTSGKKKYSVWCRGTTARVQHGDMHWLGFLGHLVKLFASCLVACKPIFGLLLSFHWGGFLLYGLDDSSPSRGKFASLDCLSGLTGHGFWELVNSDMIFLKFSPASFGANPEHHSIAFWKSWPTLDLQYGSTSLNLSQKCLNQACQRALGFLSILGVPSAAVCRTNSKTVFANSRKITTRKNPTEVREAFHNWKWIVREKILVKLRLGFRTSKLT